MAGAISHCVLGGIGLSLFLQHTLGWLWFHEIWGAVISALLSALIIGWVNLKAKEREDTIIGAVWVLGMAIGLLFFSITPEYVDPMSYLFGNIILISHTDLLLVAILDFFVIGLSLYFFNQFLAVCFDEEFSRLRGVKVDFYFLLLLCLTSLTVVFMVKVVGIVMVIALLTLPSAVAGFFTKRLWKMMVLSIFICWIFIMFGLAISYSLDLPTGPTIIVFAGTIYLLISFFNLVFKTG